MPTGAERQIGPQELFFSTTDRRGIIKAGNSVFMRISRYAADELIGAPHSIVRHPQMPAGAFRLMWDRLLAGKPMAAYVTNLAKDGASYRVFATVTPLGEDFLSVRMSPAGPLAAAAGQLYTTALAYENDLIRRERRPGPEVAAAGAREIERLLSQLGFADYDEFMLTALPGEVAARGPLLTTTFARPQATGPLAEILDAAARLNLELEHMVERLGLYRSLSSALGPATEAVLHHAHGLYHSVDVARTASQGVAEQSPVLLNVARVMGHPMSSAVEALRQLAPELGALRREVAELGFRIALARLHIEMVGAFAAEVVDRAAPASALAEVPRLCDALDGGVVAMSHAVEDVNHSLTSMATRIREASNLMQEFRRFLGQWRILVLRQRLGQALAEHMAPIDIQLDSTADQLAYLESLAAQCESSIAPFDRSSLEPHLHRVRTAVGLSRARPSL